MSSFLEAQGKLDDRFFFFSSRRRHTRFSRDWSSDECSSDLGTTLVVSSDRGIYRSNDGGETWVQKEDNLPIHIEAGPLARDPNDPGVVYAVFSLMPYAEVW